MKKLLPLFLFLQFAFSSFSQNYTVKVENNKYGIVDETGKIIIPFIYEWAQPFSEGLACVRLNNVYKFIYPNGKLAFELPGINFAKNFRDGLCCVYKDQKYGYINKSGKIVIPCIYSYASDFSEGLAAIDTNGRKGMINAAGKLVIPAIYDEIGYCREGLINVRQDGKYGYIDKKGKTAIPFIFSYAEYFTGGIARAKGQKNWGFINKKGDTVAPFIFDYVDTLINGYAIVGKNNKFGYMKPSGKLFIPMAWDRAEQWNGQKKLAIVWKGPERHWIYYRGDTLSLFPDEIGVPGSTRPDAQTQYRIISFPGDPLDFVEGYAMVIKDGKVGYKNRKEELVIPCQYAYALNFSNNVATVHNGKKWALIDKQGKNITPFMFDDVGVFDGGYIKVFAGSESYFINTKGERLQ